MASDEMLTTAGAALHAAMAAVRIVPLRTDQSTGVYLHDTPTATTDRTTHMESFSLLTAAAMSCPQ